MMVGLLLVCMGALLFQSFLPRILQSRLLPEIRKATGLSDLSFSLRRVDLFGADLAEVRTGPEDNPGLSMDAVRLDFSPLALLLDQRIKTLTLSGIDLVCQYQNGNISISGLFPLPGPSAPSGPVDKDSQKPMSLKDFTGFQVETLHLKDARLFLNLENRSIRIPLEATLQNLPETPELISCIFQGSPFGQVLQGKAELDLAQTSGSLEIQGKNLVLPDLPGPLVVEDVFAGATLKNGKVEGSGRYRINLDAPARSLTIQKIGDQPFAVAGTFDFKATDQGQWDFRLNSEKKTAPWTLSTGTTKVTGVSPILTLAGTGTGADGKMEGLFSLSGAGVNQDTLVISGISLSLPLAWPLDAPGKPGELKVSSMQWEKKDLGGITARLHQKGLELMFNGEHRNKMIPGMILKFSGQGGMAKAGFESRLHYETASHAIEKPLDLGRFVKGAKGITVKGRLALSGDFTYGPGPAGLSLKADLKKGGIDLAESRFSMQGVQTEIFFPDLFQLKSAPKQSFAFDSAKLGNLQFEKGLVEFQVESPDSFFIEKTLFKWCNGQVETRALRISPNKDEYDVVLYCDRLNLAMILMQLGAAEAQGKGAVSGRIPLAYADGRWTFDDGFLYTSPGEGGKIKIQETDKWLSAVPPGTPQYDQLRLAQEAIKDYDYNWAKLGFQTQGEDLLLQLNFNGRPANPMPFTFQKDVGKLVRLEAKETGGIQPEVFLTLNFRLPLGEVLHYKEFLNLMK